MGKTLNERRGFLYVTLSVWIYKLKLSFLFKWADALFAKGSTLYIYGKNNISATCNKPALKQEWIYTWRFHYNPYVEEWCAYHIDDSRNYANGVPTLHPVVRAQTLEGMLAMLLITQNKDHRNLYGC